MPDSELNEIIRGSWPFILVDLVILAVLVAFPKLVLWLPSKM